MPPQPPRLQLERFLESLGQQLFSIEESPDIFNCCCDWVSKLPYEVNENDRIRFKEQICRSFQISMPNLEARLAAGDGGRSQIGVLPPAAIIDVAFQNASLEKIINRAGFIRRYVDYTMCAEAPLAYHIFSAIVGLGAVVNRRVWIDMGVFKIFPATGVIILGPSGIKKTSATDIIVEILGLLGTVKLYSEKLTPEALIEAMIGDATGLIYAPEATTFLNRQKYNEGLVNLLTRFMDCPTKWSSGTVMRKERKLDNIGLSILMCSALEYFIPDVPPEAIKGGFLPRNIIVLQEECDRVIPRPSPTDREEFTRLVHQLALIHSEANGEFALSKEADELHDYWYRGDLQYQKKHLQHEMMGPFLNRKDGHIFRMAMILHMSDCGSMCLCGPCYAKAIKLIDWAEQFLPGLFNQMFRTQSGEEQELVLKTIRNAGEIKHYQLVSRLSYKFEAERVRKILQSLKEQKLVDELNDNLKGHRYRMRGGEDVVGKSS